MGSKEVITVSDTEQLTDALALTAPCMSLVVAAMTFHEKVVEAQELLDKMKGVIKVQDELRACEIKGEAAGHMEISAVLLKASKLEMDLDVMVLLGERLKKLDAELPKKKADWEDGWDRNFDIQYPERTNGAASSSSPTTSDMSWEDGGAAERVPSDIR